MNAPRPSTLASLAAAVTAIAWACITDDGTDAHDPLRLAIVASEVEHVIAPTLDELEHTAAALRDATAAWSAAAEAGEDPTAARDTAREAWRQAMTVWQRAEVLQIGPAGSSAYVVGGEDLRDDVYAWPTIDACRVDEELVAQSYTSAGFFADSLVNVRGLAAVDLLFSELDTSACLATDPINVDGSWAALGPEEVARRRAAYAAAAAVAVATIAGDLAARWVPGSGQFAVWITAPGEDGSPYENATRALDDVLGASFYVDGTLKDAKLVATVRTDTESPWALLSKEHALANLEGLRQLLLGGRSAAEGTGFDDFLVELGEDALAAELMAAIGRAVAAVEAVDGSFETALDGDPAALAAAHAAVQEVTDLLKGPVATALRLTSPGEAAGDAD